MRWKTLMWLRVRRTLSSDMIAVENELLVAGSNCSAVLGRNVLQSNWKC